MAPSVKWAVVKNGSVYENAHLPSLDHTLTGVSISMAQAHIRLKA